MRSARIVEDIKDRFYFIMRRILEERNLAGVNVPENVLYSRQYDKSYVSQPRTLSFPLTKHHITQQLRARAQEAAGAHLCAGSIRCHSRREADGGGAQDSSAAQKEERGNAATTHGAK